METHFEQDYFGDTVLSPVGLAAVLVLGTAMLLLPRRYAVWPMIFMACFIAPAQRIAILSLNFDLLRLMVLFGTVRILSRKEWEGFRWKKLDYAVIAWAIVATVGYTMLYGTADALKYKLGTSYDAIGMYFMFRCLVRSFADVEMVTVGFVVASVPVTLAFLIEHSTGHNLFAFMGGVPAMTEVRDGRLRCQGAFAHSILAGCFWASVLPLIVAQWWRGRSGRKWAVIGSITSCTIIVMCASSTPVAAVMFGCVAACFYPLRNRMRWIRWGAVAMLLPLQLVMKNPVWHLIVRADIVGGSTGWHRYHLIDEAINHFGEWWMVGTQDTGHWGYGLEDVTNQYVLEGVRGGVLTLALFVLIIALAFGGVGRMWRSARSQRERILAWALGVSLFVHVTSFIGVSYFGQINMLWYLTLAMIGSLAPARVVIRQRADAHAKRRPNTHRVGKAVKPAHGPAASVPATSA